MILNGIFIVCIWKHHNIVNFLCFVLKITLNVKFQPNFSYNCLTISIKIQIFTLEFIWNFLNKILSDPLVFDGDPLKYNIFKNVWFSLIFPKNIQLKHQKCSVWLLRFFQKMQNIFEKSSLQEDSEIFIQIKRFQQFKTCLVTSKKFKNF